MEFKRPQNPGRRLKQNHVKLIETKYGQFFMTMPKGIVDALSFEKGMVFKTTIAENSIMLSRIENLTASNVRLKQNNVLLQQTKNGQFHVTIPRAIALALMLKDGEVTFVSVQNGLIKVSRT